MEPKSRDFKIGLTELNNEFIQKSRKNPVPQSEAGCSTEECAKLIEAAHVWAAHHNIILQ